MIDRLPTPYGLVRYGVAPDHKSIKSIAEYLRGVLEHDGVKFVGGVHLGTDVTRDDLLACYDAVVYATGAMRDRKLGIPGEELPGSFAATDFVNWYCGHPDIDPAAFSLDAESVAVIGVGNVAVDVASILVRNPAELRETDVPQPVLDALTASKVREVHMIGRRGPAQAKFTTKELRELGELDGVDIAVGPGEADLDAFDPTGEQRRAGGNRPARPRQLCGDQGLGGAGPGRRRAQADGQVLAAAGRNPGTGTGDGADSGADQAGRPGPGHRDRRAGESSGPAGAAQRRLPERAAARCPVRRAQAHTVPNAEGRVLGADGKPLPGEYVAGWLKRGPTGVIGTNKSDAAQTVRALLADLAGGPGPHDVQLPGPACCASRSLRPTQRPMGRGVISPAGRSAGQPRHPAGQLRRRAANRDGGEGTRRGARPRRPGRAGQPE